MSVVVNSGVIGTHDTDVEADAIAELRAGRPVVVWSGGPGGALGLLVAAGRSITVTTMAFLVRHCSGLVCVTVPSADCVRLSLPAMPLCDDDGFATEMRVTVDAANGDGTGISAHDRAWTARLLSDPATCRDDLTRPGHVIPVRVDSDAARGTPTQQVADLVRAAGLGGHGVFSHLIAPDGVRLADEPSTAQFAARHRLIFLGQEFSQ